MSQDEEPPAPALLERLAEGELRLHELEEVVDADRAAEVRRRFIEEETGAELSSVANFGFEAAAATSNIENMIGATQVPLGVVGPIRLAGGASDGRCWLPLATTEGALIASVNRGLSAIRRAGGATGRVLANSMTRGPVFRVPDVGIAAEVVTWVQAHEDQLRQAAEATTSHGELEQITPYVVGNNVFLRFGYDTKDAMGMNMATIATQAACELVEAETDAELVALSGNLCTDKKPAAINAVEGRGRTVCADIVIPREIVEETFDTTPEAMVEVNTRKNLIGSAKAGALGFNAQAANIVAAAFLALGQDIAQVVEGSNAITTMEIQDGALYASLTFSSLELGTVGGGTNLPSQAEALGVVGVKGGGDPGGSNADALAEIVAGAALGGELSLVGALSASHLASAHEQLGR
jgi:hydroxymethylglutaryl-CoA reductase (NADPH)